MHEKESFQEIRVKYAMVVKRPTAVVTTLVSSGRLRAATADTAWTTENDHHNIVNHLTQSFQTRAGQADTTDAGVTHADVLLGGQ